MRSQRLVFGTAGAAALAVALAACQPEPPPQPPPELAAAPAPDAPTSRPTSRPTRAPGDCVGSCSAVVDEHPPLSSRRYHELLERFRHQPASSESEALETLLFHHARTRELIAEHGLDGLDRGRAELLTREAARTHAWLDVRVIDAKGTVRLRLRPTRVPLGIKQHMWPTERVALQPAELSGTVKRVGLRHLWTRL